MKVKYTFILEIDLKNIYLSIKSDKILLTTEG